MTKFVLFALLIGSPVVVTAQHRVEATDAPALLEYVGSHPATVHVVNFWATWCGPCVTEFPYFTRIHREMQEQDVHVTFVSMDFFPDEEAEADVEAFLERQGVTWRTFIKNQRDDPFITAIHDDWSGAIPATVLYKNGTVHAFIEGPVTFEQLHDAVQAARH